MPTQSAEPMRIMPSDRRFFEVTYLQELLIDAVNAQIAQASIRDGQSKQQDFVAGRKMDVQDLPAPELAAHIELLKQRQRTILVTPAAEYVSDPAIELLHDLVTAHEVCDEPTESQVREAEAGWEAAFAATVFAEFIEELEF